MENKIRWIRRYQNWLPIAIGSVVLVLILISFFLISQRQQRPLEPAQLLLEDETTVSSRIEAEEEVAIYVDVKGAVKKPGMYKVRQGQRVWHVLGLAGGMTAAAETKAINYSQKVADQLVIYVPEQGEVSEFSTASTEVIQQVQESETNKVDLNQADETQLQTLSGIGLKKAQEIIRYREENNGFTTIDELKNVSGIGEKTVESLKEYLKVS